MKIETSAQPTCLIKIAPIINENTKGRIQCSSSSYDPVICVLESLFIFKTWCLLPNTFKGTNAVSHVEIIFASIYSVKELIVKIFFALQHCLIEVGCCKIEHVIDKEEICEQIEGIETPSHDNIPKET